MFVQIISTADLTLEAVHFIAFGFVYLKRMPIGFLLFRFWFFRTYSVSIYCFIYIYIYGTSGSFSLSMNRFFILVLGFKMAVVQ